jgi:hypothetical protein
MQSHPFWDINETVADYRLPGLSYSYAKIRLSPNTPSPGSQSLFKIENDPLPKTYYASFVAELNYWLHPGKRFH